MTPAARPARLTDAEFGALVDAVVMAELEWTDNRMDRADTLRAQAATRALRKVQDAMRPRPRRAAARR